MLKWKSCSYKYNFVLINQALNKITHYKDPSYLMVSDDQRVAFWVIWNSELFCQAVGSIDSNFLKAFFPHHYWKLKQFWWMKYDTCQSALALFFVACKRESSFTYLNSVWNVQSFVLSEKLQNDFDPALLELKQESLMIP